MTLNELFTAIANQIRRIKGTSETIKAENFATEMSTITTGNLSDEEYAEANDDLDDILEGSTPTKIFPPDWSQIGYEDTPQDIIDGFNYAKEIYDNWDSSATNLNSKFAGNTNLRFMPLVDTGNVTDMYRMLSSCTNLFSVPKFDTSETTRMYGMFSSCNNLNSVPLFNTSNVIDMQVMFSYCNKLTNDSLNNILKMCINATKITNNKTLRYIGLSQTQAETCQTLSNYQAFLDAGWTTGY